MAGKNITYQAWVKKEQQTHRRNVKNMSSHLIASGAMNPPARVAVLEANPRKQMLDAERIQAIEAENARLLRKMTKIMDQGPSFSVLHRSKVFISNAVSRKQAAMRIAAKNLEFCERINKTKPYYDTKKWDEERQATEHILKGMGLYPYHPPQPKRWQDYFEPEVEEDAADTGVEEELDRQWVQSLASFSNRPSQIDQELSRSDSFSPKSLRRPKGDSWMLPGLARPGQYSKDSSGRVSQTQSDGRMQQLPPDSPSHGAASSVSRSGVRLQPLARTPALEAAPRRNDVPILNSRPNSTDSVTLSTTDRANLWSSDGKEGVRGRLHAGQQQFDMSLRNDDPEDESLAQVSSDPSIKATQSPDVSMHSKFAATPLDDGSAGFSEDISAQLNAVPSSASAPGADEAAIDISSNEDSTQPALAVDDSAPDGTPLATVLPDSREAVLVDLEDKSAAAAGPSHSEDCGAAAVEREAGDDNGATGDVDSTTPTASAVFLDNNTLGVAARRPSEGDESAVAALADDFSSAVNAAENDGFDAAAIAPSSPEMMDADIALHGSVQAEAEHRFIAATSQLGSTITDADAESAEQRAAPASADADF
jgi:hypothetical protein